MDSTDTNYVSRRELNCVRIISWILALAIHLAGAIAIGHYIDWKMSTFEVQMTWSDAPLTGFGMMDVYEDVEVAPEPPPQVDEEENPFEEEETEDSPVTEADFDPSSIVEPEPVEESAAEETPQQPSHDLSKDKKRLAAVRADVDSMPDLHVLAPGNARLIVLIRNDRLLGSKFENSVRRLFKAFPDYRFALGASEIDPVRDIQAMLIATANPELYAETFLVVSHHIPEERLKQYIGKSFPTEITWGEHNGRPLATPNSKDGRYNPRSGIYKRSLFLADDHTVLFLKPEVLPTLDVAHVDAIINTRDKDLEENPEQAKTFLESLGGIGMSDSASAPTLFFMVQGIDGVNLGRGFPKFQAPRAVMASMSTANRPHVNLQATFEDKTQAQKFVEVWPDIVSSASGMGVPGLGGLLNALDLTNEGPRVLMSGDLNGTMIGLVLMFAASYLERSA